MDSGNGSSPAVFGLWETTVIPTTRENIAFDLGSEAPASQEYAVWRADLPANPVEAERLLEQRDAQIQQVSAALDALPESIQSLASQAKTPSFDLSAVSFGPEEASLLGMVADLDQASTGVVSYDLGQVLGMDWANAYQQFRASFERIQQLITQMAWVETRAGGQVVGWTVVGWSGDMNTTWEETALPEQRGLHQHSLQQALATRLALLRVLAVTLQGAGMMAILIANPGGALLALPAVWKYINQVLDQVKQYQQVSQP